MPDINNRGEIIGGRGVCWLTDDLTKSDNRANILVARNGRWFGSTPDRVFNDHLELYGVTLVGDMNAARGACGQDGTVAFWLGYPDGGDVQLIDMDAVAWPIFDAWPQGNGSFAILDRQTACWVDGKGRFRAHGMLVPVKLPGDIHNLNLFRFQGKIWLAYHSNVLGKIVMHPEHSLHGYVFEPGFYLCVRETVQGVMLCTASNPADDPNPPILIDFTRPRTDLAALLPQPEPDPEPEPEPEPTPMPTIPNYLHLIAPLWAQHGGPTDDHAAAFLRASARLLHAKDARVGLWKKATPWGHDVDKLVFKMAEGGVWFVDIVANAGAPNAAPSWQDGAHHYFPMDDQTNWMKPEGVTPQPDPIPDPHQPDPLQKQIDALVKRVALLEAKPSGGINGKKVALRTAHGKYLCAQDDDSVVADRPTPGEWETFSVHEQE